MARVRVRCGSIRTASCYRRSLEEAVAHLAKSVAFPAISTGVYRFPLERATRIAMSTARDFLADDSTIERVIFCCFSGGDVEVYRRIAAELEIPVAEP